MPTTPEISEVDETKMRNELRLTRLYKKEQALLTRMQAYYNLMKKADADISQLSTFISRAKTCRDLREDYVNVIDEMYEVKMELDSAYVPTYSELDSFDDLYCAVNDAYTFYEEKKKVKRLETSSSKNQYPKLQPINIPDFNGSPEEWPTFFQLFSKMIDENKNLSDIEKVSHLVTHLKGSAKSVCASVAPTAENYKLLLQTLKQRYEDKRMLASTYLDKVLNFKPIGAGSEKSLSALMDGCIEPINALKQLNIGDLSDFILFHLVFKKLDSENARLFENNNRTTEIPVFGELVKFVSEQTKIISRTSPIDRSFGTSKKCNNNGGNNFNVGNSNKSISVSKNSSNYALLAQEPSPLVSGADRSSTTPTPKIMKCALCTESVHPLFMCSSYKKMSVDDRWNYAKNNKVCFNCLSPGLHLSSSCKSSKYCPIESCGRRHHRMLHRFFDANATPKVGGSGGGSGSSNSNATNPQENSDQTQSFCATSKVATAQMVLLATATVVARDSEGVVQELRAILDCGSQSHFITRKACKKLGLSCEPFRYVVRGIGTSPLNVSACATLNFFSRVDPTHKYIAHTLVVDRLTERVPSASCSLVDLPHIQNLVLADEKFFEPHEVDLLIGAELWPLIVGADKKVGPPGTPVALQTTLGYVVMGGVSISALDIQPNLCFFAQPSLESLVERFWSIEDVPRRTVMSADEMQCESLFVDTCRRNADGSFTVRLPFRESPELLGASKGSCIAKLLSLERRLHKTPHAQQLYAGLIEEYLRDGVISKIGTAAEISDQNSFFMPHHGVFRPDHPTTPLRIVWNASAPTSSSYSLNQLLFVGPKLHSDIFEVLIHFRLFRYALTADVKRMFLQISVAAEDRKYQRFLWRSDSEHPIDVYEINKVVFGVASSPYLANRIVRCLAEQEKFRFPLAAEVALRDVYVDDVTTSLESEEQLTELYHQLSRMFSAGKFTLSKWNSNSRHLMKQIPEEARLFPAVDFDADSSSKVLGVQWVPQHDTFGCKVDDVDVPCTKRNVLSIMARIFDPLGLVAPVTLVAKLLIKDLWLEGVDWDEEPPESFIESWESFRKSLPHLKKISVPRHVGIASEVSTRLVGFADSSSKAYGACVYVQVQLGGSYDAKLLCAKSRVAPSKIMSIPRLELCAALLLSHLVRSVMDSYSSRHQFSNIVAFTDSRVVLHWIQSDPSRWKMFVSNRIVQIQERIPATCWRHVSGEENPADVLSRGTTPEKLLEHPLWFTGPPWLSLGEEHWPAPTNDTSHNIPEVEVKITSHVVTSSNNNILAPLIDQVSTYRKLLRATAYVFRACTKQNLRTPFVKSSELLGAEDYWIRNIQAQYLADELDRIRKGKPITSNIRHLDPFLQDGILRVGGRLQNAKSLSFEEKHPILLPSKCRFVDLLITQYHVDLLHAGAHLILTNLRSRYWIPAAKTRIRSCVHRCNTCYRASPRPKTPKMAPLPEFRVEGGLRAFERAGVDYAGPISITPYRQRGQQNLRKSYICLFICLAVKAVHIELVSDLTAECFLNAYKRFLSRRGPCKFLLSDGGTNFKGARRMLNELEELMQSSRFQAEVGSDLAARGVEWKMNVPSAPWMGGIWESNIKCMKHHLRRIVGNQILTFEEMSTVLVQIEAIMNSRPLCVLSDEPNAPTALTPAHFLTLGPTLDRLPAPNLTTEPMNRLNRYQLIDYIVQHYWLRWRKEYLHTLQSRAKWTTETTEIPLGSVVVIVRDNIPPLQWPLGVVESVYPGGDGVVRAVGVRTATGVLRRPVSKVCPLPTQ